MYCRAGDESLRGGEGRGGRSQQCNLQPIGTEIGAESRRD